MSIGFRKLFDVELATQQLAQGLRRFPSHVLLSFSGRSRFLSPLCPQVLLTALPLVWGNSMYIAKLCKGRTCNDASFPILDYDASTQTCVCNAHPCWNDNGLVHSCPGDNKEET